MKGQLKELAALPPQNRLLHTLFRKLGLPRLSLDAMAKRNGFRETRMEVRINILNSTRK
jgi:hypothetical protein